MLAKATMRPRTRPGDDSIAKEIVMRFALIALTLLIAGCGSDKPINFTCARFSEFLIPVPVTPGGSVQGATAPLLDERIGGAMNDSGAGVGAMAAVAPPAGNPAPRADNILVLSGGGKWGAYGAGLLDAWSDQSDAPLPRPRFDVVTGISTGALQSTFAFLGSETDENLVEAYSIQREAQLARRHGSLFFLRHGSMASLQPLIGYARQRAEPFFERVAQEHRQGRVLLVGLVDALDGRLYAADLTRIAAELSGEERANCYVGALLASAAIPVVFTQVRINNRPYFDGGVRQSVFLTGIQQSLARVTARRGTAGNLFVLLNGVPGAGTAEDVRPNILSPLARLREITFDQIEQSSIYAVSQQTPGLTTWVATAEGHGCPDPHGSDEDIFNPQFMNCLIAAGRNAVVAGVNPWERYPRN
jgi:predicted patatin/cPLA2 family phospholipase